MDMNTKPLMNESPLQVAEGFAAKITAERALAIEGLRADLSRMDSMQIRQCAERLCEILAEEEGSAEVLSTVFGVLERLESSAQ
jgi:hypothetical protein